MASVDDEIVVRRNPWVSSVRMVVGAMCVLFGISLATDLVDFELAVIAISMMAIGLPQIVVGAHQLVTRSPALRADGDGIWFGGGRVVPWRAVAAIYEVHVQVSVNLVPAGKGSLVKIDFHRAWTSFRLPVGAWPMALLREGVQLHDAKAAVFVSRLEAMRTRARGTEEAVTAGATEVPPARVVRS